MTNDAHGSGGGRHDVRQRRAVVRIEPGADPRRCVAGMSLLERCVRTVRSWGIARPIVVVPDCACGSPERLSELGELSAGAPVVVASALSQALREDRGDLVVVSATTVYDRAAGAAIGAPPAGGACRVGGVTVIEASAVPRLVPEDLIGADELAAKLPRSLLRERAAPSLICIPVHDDAGARRAEQALFDACRKPVDGIVSRTLNRRVSLFLSRRLVHTSVHPNHISVLCILLGAVAAALTLGGAYGWVLAGAATLQLNSILDGVDGELARVRWQQSKLGELLDSAGDNLSNFAYFGALAWVAAHRGHPTLALAGAAGLAMWSLYLAFLYAQLWGIRRGDVMLVTKTDALGSGAFGRLVRLGRTVLRRDSFVLLAALLAAAGRPFWMLPLVLSGGASVFAYALSRWARALLQRFDRDGVSSSAAPIARP